MNSWAFIGENFVHKMFVYSITPPQYRAGRDWPRKDDSLLYV